MPCPCPMRAVRIYMLPPSICSHTFGRGSWRCERGGEEGREETVDRADFDGASRGEVRIEWLTLCPPADPMDLKPMDAV